MLIRASGKKPYVSLENPKTLKPFRHWIRQLGKHLTPNRLLLRHSFIIETSPFNNFYVRARAVRLLSRMFSPPPKRSVKVATSYARDGYLWEETHKVGAYNGRTN